ncbi:LysR family transcriptional regulator [Thalassococcus sp. CAU 1522]|uniref:LysR family transcriptional regulator n=1 Tax=Thalassococcus arenae TaxID=2851652 RepID=A0ABS6N5D4_9RHOB|nr:LysR family transcriptional regulator [Thalassococcus arenae]MBV2359232.1 LysR family transcriptional regulator [Thalassococcus arenae]
MNASLSSLDWSLIQTFLTVAETGSLSQAARRLGISQPTAGRQIKQIEEALALTLFHRKARGLQPTDAAHALLPHARAMADGMHALSLTAAGRSDRLAGPVRITASQFTAHHHLPPILARIRQEEPDISIDLVPNDASENLLYREADIAVRMFRSEQLDIVTRHLGDLELGIYGARAYLDRAGRPKTFDEFFDFDLIGYDRSDLILRGLRDYGVEATRDWFATRCDNHSVYFELLRAGCGLGFAQRNLADRYPELERLFPDMPLPTLPVWLAAHEAVRDTPRIRRVWDILAEGLAPQVS